MKLVALQAIRHGGGTIAADQPFLADPDSAQRYIAAGAAATEADYEARPWNGSGYWRVQPEWRGETVAIVGGGPSLSADDVRQAQQANGRQRFIVINNAVELAPWADLLYFCDARWYEWHRERVQAFRGVRVTLENLPLQKELDVRCLRDYGVHGFAPKADGVTNGRNGGYQALHLAAWLGAKRVLLLGFDMKPKGNRLHWHAEHPVATPPSVFAGWLKAFATLAPHLKARGVEVINCTPDSALTVFPFLPLEAALNFTATGEIPARESLL